MGKNDWVVDGCLKKIYGRGEKHFYSLLLQRKISSCWISYCGKV